MARVDLPAVNVLNDLIRGADSAVTFHNLAVVADYGNECLLAMMSSPGALAFHRDRGRMQSPERITC